MLVLEKRIDHDLFGLEVMQIDHRHTRVRFVVDKEVAAVVLTFGFRECGVVGIAEVDVPALDTSLGKHSFGFVVKTIALPWLGCKHADVFENAHGGDSIHNDLPALAA